MPKKYVFIGCQRSGHHAIMRWFAAQHKNKDFSHYNNCRKGKRQIMKKQQMIEKTVVKGGVCNCCNFNKTISDLRKPTNNMVFNFENKKLRYIENCCNFEPINNKDVLKIIIYRDHYNWIASYINKWSIKRLKASKAIERWKEYAEKILEIASGDNDNYDFIIYNDWVTSKEYRKKICQKYGLKFTDKMFKSISKHGEGSSFTKLEKFDSRKYNQRCEMYMEDEDYLEIVNDPTLVYLTESISLIKKV